MNNGTPQRFRFTGAFDLMPLGAGYRCRGMDRHSGVPARPSEDEYRAQHVRDALAHDPRVADLSISVTVEAGAVHLSGQVSTEERRNAAAEVARETLGDHDVRNEVTVSDCDEPDGVENLP